MSCDYLPNKLNYFVKKIPWFNNVSRNILIFILMGIMVASMFFSKEALNYLLKIFFIIILLSFGRDDFLKILADNKSSKTQSSMYCFFMYFSILVGVLFIIFF